MNTRLRAQKDRKFDVNIKTVCNEHLECKCAPRITRILKSTKIKCSWSRIPKRMQILQIEALAKRKSKVMID